VFWSHTKISLHSIEETFTFFSFGMAWFAIVVGILTTFFSQALRLGCFIVEFEAVGISSSNHPRHLWA